MPEKIVTTSSEAVTSVIFGTCDENVRAIEERFGVRIANNGVNRNGVGDAILVSGPNAEGVRLAVETLEYLKRMTADGDTLSEGSVSYVMSSVESGEAEDLGSLSDVICVTMKGKPIRPKTVGQKKYVDAIKKNTVTIGVGPAGTGKTFLAVAMAVEAPRVIKRVAGRSLAMAFGERSFPSSSKSILSGMEST